MQSKSPVFVYKRPFSTTPFVLSQQMPSDEDEEIFIEEDYLEEGESWLKIQLY
jgi:hypothetical protein